MVRSSLAPSLLALALFVSCSAPAPAETSVTLSSERGLVQATVRFLGPVRRGENALVAELSAASPGAEPRLAAVSAFMVTHNHEAHAGSISETDGGFEASELDLFMTGRWQLELELSVAGEPDLLSLPVDVP